jgi:hypothetical protein
MDLKRVFRRRHCSCTPDRAKSPEITSEEAKEVTVKRFAVTLTVAVLMWGAAPRRSEASAFVINVLTSSSSGGHSRGGAGDGIPGGGGGAGGGFPTLTLGGPAIGGAIGKGAVKPSTPQEVAAAVQQLVSEAQSAAPTGPLGAMFPSGQTSGAPGAAPGLAHLNLGGDDYLTVSGAVGQSLSDNLNQGNGHGSDIGTAPTGPAMNGAGDVVAGNGGSGTSSPGSDNSGTGSGNAPPRDLNSVLPEVSTGILLSIDETGALNGSGSNSISQVEIAATPEPGSLLLFGSGLAFVAYWIRGRKFPAGRR